MAKAKSTFAGILKPARRKRGFTQIEVARICGVSQATYSKLENGVVEPSAPFYLNFCDLTQLDAERSYAEGTPYTKKGKPLVI